MSEYIVASSDERLQEALRGLNVEFGGENEEGRHGRNGWWRQSLTHSVTQLEDDFCVLRVNVRVSFFMRWAFALFLIVGFGGLGSGLFTVGQSVSALLMGVGIGGLLIAGAIVFIEYHATYQKERDFVTRLRKSSGMSVANRTAFDVLIESRATCFLFVVILLSLSCLAVHYLGWIIGGPIAVVVASLVPFMFGIWRVSCGWRRYYHTLHGVWMVIVFVLMMILLLKSGMLWAGYLKCNNDRINSPRHANEVPEAISSVIFDERWASGIPRDAARSGLCLNQQVAENAFVEDQVSTIIAFVVITFMQITLVFFRRRISVPDNTEPAFIHFHSHVIRPLFSRELWVWPYLGLTFLVNVVYCLVSLEIVIYAFSGHSILLWMVGPVMAMAAVTAEQAGLSILLATLVSEFSFLLLALPGLAIIAVSICRMFKIIWWTTGLGRDDFQRLPVEYQDWIQSRCGDLKIPIPRVRIGEGDKTFTHANGSLFRRRGVLVLSAKSLKKITSDEIKALLAHELHHIENDAWKVTRLKLVSVFLLCPIQYPILFHDYDNCEKKADDFAVKHSTCTALIDAVLYEECLKNYSTSPRNNCKPKQRFSPIEGNIDKNEIHWRQRSWRWLLMFTISFKAYFDDTLYGAAYTDNRERLARLKKKVD